VRVFVSEYVCGGAWDDGPLDGSLAQEGRSMLLAACADFARIPEVRVVTTWDARLGPFPLSEVPAILSDPRGELQECDRLAGECDAAFVIAPEFDQILTNRSWRVELRKLKSLISSSTAIELCADKLKLAGHFAKHAIPTIETVRWWPNDPCPDDRFPIVIKPRFGAGSQNTFVVKNREQLEPVERAFSGREKPWEAIAQPYLAGRAMSVAMLVDATSGHVEIFPPAEQFLSDDGRLRYLGGRIQAGNRLRDADREIIEAACRSIPGLSGYIGFDLLTPHDDPTSMRIVEINPRLTTSYLGYRVLCEENIMERVLFPEKFPEPMRWADRAARFTPDGRVTFEDC
jgi:predicted ATP-grasp superfamily ATP-dependent carboligase